MVDNRRPVKKRSEAASASRRLDPQAPRGEHRPHLRTTLYELANELVFVFVLVMFIKTFLVEHYKIPTGSMTPTLIGGYVAQVDVNGDGVKDLVYAGDSAPLNPGRLLVFVKKDGRYEPDTTLRPSFEQFKQWAAEGLFHKQDDHVLVNRFAYWFHPPRRGEIVVFKVPPAIFKPEAPIYIKRCVGEPGDTLTFTREGRLVVGGQVVEQPDFFRRWRYLPLIETNTNDFSRQSEIAYRPFNTRVFGIDSIHVPADKVYVFGDNTGGAWTADTGGACRWRTSRGAPSCASGR